MKKRFKIINLYSYDNTIYEIINVFSALIKNDGIQSIIFDE